jgi:hypothetical protein
MKLLLSYTSRSLAAGIDLGTHYTSTELDFEMMRLCQRIKRGSRKAAIRAEELLAEHPPVFFKEDMELPEHAQWREWYAQGASIGAIARHVDATHYKVQRVVDGVTQVGSMTPQALGLTPRPSWPASVSEGDVAAWREAVAAGDTARQVARRYGCHPQYVQNATCDLRW